ncbi:MAG: hypothetical protein EB060_11305 [Proteobacteria bacterium]|nr:hypothetical protein [Pseudomonadota bacterium]
MKMTKLASAALVAAIATAGLSACSHGGSAAETKAVKERNAYGQEIKAHGKNSCKGKASCKGKSSCGK